jgi:predicted XRE-type DNA-binding protein
VSDAAERFPRARTRGYGESAQTLTLAQALRVRKVLSVVIDREGSQVAAGRALSVSQQLVSQIMAGKAPGPYIAALLAEHTGLPIEYFHFGAPAPFERLLFEEGLRWSELVLATAIKSAHAHPKSVKPWDTDRWRERLDALAAAMDRWLEGGPA